MKVGVLGAVRHEASFFHPVIKESVRTCKQTSQLARTSGTSLTAPERAEAWPRDHPSEAEGRPPSPVTRVEGRTFQFSFPLPEKIQQPAKPSKKAKTPEPTGKNKAKPQKDEGQVPVQSGKTTSDRKEYEKARNQRPDRKEYNRIYMAKRRQEEIANGVCVRCEKEAPEEGKLKCRKCADKHNAENRKYATRPEAIEKQKARVKGYQERGKTTADAE